MLEHSLNRMGCNFKQYFPLEKSSSSRYNFFTDKKNIYFLKDKLFEFHARS